MISVVMLGQFNIYVNGNSALAYIGNSPKSLFLLKYLILSRNKPVPISELIDVFWGDEEKCANPENALKTMISRIRSGLMKVDPMFENCVVAKNKAYLWSPRAHCEVDVFQFEKLCRQVKKAEHLEPHVRDAYMRILNLYRGDLAGSSEEAEWIISRSLQLHGLYLRNIYQFIHLLKTNGDNETIIQISRVALAIDTFDETINLELMLALNRSGQNNAALMQYEHITGSYYKVWGIRPPDSILNNYKDIIKTDLTSRVDTIHKIRQELLEGEEDLMGAFVCDYSIFKEICKLQLRNIDRQPNQLFLMLLTLECPPEQDLPAQTIDAIMWELVEITKRSLRRGDTLTRYSTQQCALLLPMMDYTNGAIVYRRIAHKFHDAYPNQRFKLLYQFDALTPYTPITSDYAFDVR